MKSRIMKILDITSLVLGCMMLILIVSIVHNQIILKISSFTSKGYEVGSRIRDISKIYEEESWYLLNNTQKLKILQDICNFETREMDADVMVVADNFPENLWGVYRDSDYVIKISKKHLEESNPKEIMLTLMHELKHHQQKTLVGLYVSTENNVMKKLKMFENCDLYIKEMMTYENGDEDFEYYYNLYMEKESRAYSEMRVNEWYTKIEEVLTK